jgi:UDP-N-acetyl-D-glucosamine dehydrogenase
VTATQAPKHHGAADRLQELIDTNRAVVGVIGLGYVGLPLAHALHQGGLPVVGFDIDRRKIDCIARKENYLKHLGDEMISSLADSKRFSATTDFARLGECDVIIVCVPTPLGRHQEPDISYILNTAEAIGRTLRPGQLVILESTTYPGTTRDDMMPAIMKAAGSRGQGLMIGRDLFGAFSPEREDPGRKSHSTSTIPKLVGGLDQRSTELAASVYRKGVTQVVPVSSAEVAESAKLLENIFRCVNIAMVNELKTVLTPMGIDVWEVIRAASTKPFGFMPFFPGPGLGGHCIPIDPFYLTWKAKEVGKNTRFIELAGEINTAMPH